MAGGSDYIPRGDAELQVFAAGVYNYAMDNHERWKVPSPNDLVAEPFAAYVAALGKFNSPNHGKIDTKNKNDAKKVLIKALRTYIQGYIARNPLVTDEDKKNMSLPLRDVVASAHPVPGEKPETEAVPDGTGVHRVTAVNPVSQTKKKPRLVSGVAFARRLRKPADPVSKAEEMPSVYQAGTGRVFRYAEADYGMIADYATAYENGSGKRGPWSNVTSLLVSG